MPQPIRGKCHLTYYPGVLKERPNHAIGIALVASEWCALEADLILLFTYSLIPPGPWAPGVWSKAPAASSVARAAWDAMDSLKPRLEFIQSVAKKKLPEPLYKEFVTEVVPEVRARAGERNRVVHGYWNVSPQYPDDLILVSEDELVRYTVKDFEDIAGRINSTVTKVADYWVRVRQTGP